MRTLLALLILTTTATAQTPVIQSQPGFTPYTIDQKTHQDLMNYLGEMPAKWAVPIINALAKLEQDAQKAREKASDSLQPIK